MEKDYTPCTIEDYDKSLRQTVNNYYTHALNDPSMSKEEAIQQTAQMAENYLNTMDDLESAHENGEIASIADQNQASETSTVDNEASGPSEGPDGGMDGGIE